MNQNNYNDIPPVVSSEDKYISSELVPEGIYAIVMANYPEYAISIEDEHSDILTIKKYKESINQLFVIKRSLDDEENCYEISSVVSGKVFDVEAEQKFNGVKVIQYERNGGENQKWNIVQKEKENYYIVSKSSGFFLEGETERNMINLYIWQCNGNQNQIFKFIQVFLDNK